MVMGPAADVPIASGENAGQSQSRFISLSRTRIARKSQTWMALA